jgi:WD40 repeat protein
MSFAPDGKTIASGYSYVEIRDTVTGHLAVKVPTLPEGIIALSFAANPDALVACLRDGHVTSWNPLTGKQLAPFATPPAEIGKPTVFLYFSTFPDNGKIVGSIDVDGTLLIWEPASGT